jgi:hypothetical protein
MHSEVNYAEDTSLTNHSAGVENVDSHIILQEKSTNGTITAPDEAHVSVASSIVEPVDVEKHLDHSPTDLSSADAYDEDETDSGYPEGGLRAWSVVFGSFCGTFAVFGLINTTGIFQQYLSENQLKDYTPSQIGWIWGLGLFLTFFCGVFIGPIFDSRGPKLLVFLGSIFLGLSIMLFGLCTSKYFSLEI